MNAVDSSVYWVNSNGGNWSGAGDFHMGSSTFNNRPGAVFDAMKDGFIHWPIGDQPLFNNAGTFRKSGSANFTDLNGVPIANTGTVDVQSGMVRFLSSYTQTGGRLQFGLTDLSHFGQVQFSQPAPLTGTLGVNLLSGFRPRDGDAFAVISYYPSYSGAFGNFDLPSLAAWQTNNTIYGANAVTLTVLNGRPTLDFITDKTGGEQTIINFTAGATDPDVGQLRTFSLFNAPTGAGINASTGAFNWTPTEAQGPSTNVFTVQVTDNGAPALSRTQAVTIIVNEVNRPPQFAGLGLPTISELAFASFTDVATDPDLPPNSIHYELLSAPAGAMLSASTAVINWTPTEAQGPGTYEIAIVAIDDGMPPLRSTNRFTLLVTEVNSAPAMLPIPDLTAVQDVLLLYTNTVSDTDLPANTLSFSLITSPKGMAVGKANGVLQWKPTIDQVPSTNPVTIRVTDNGVPPLSDLRSFTVYAFTLPHLNIVRATGGMELSWPAYATGFSLQSASNLKSSIVWVPWTNTVSRDGITNQTIDDSTSTERYYRLQGP